MLPLSVDANAFVDDQKFGRIHIVFQEEGFLWNSEGSEPRSVKYYQIKKYGTSVRDHNHRSLPCLYLRYNVDDDHKLNQVCIHFDFEKESVLVAVLNVLLEYANDDPYHYVHDHYTSADPSKGSKDTFAPHIDRKVSVQVSCMTALFVRTHVTFLQFVGNLILAGVGDHLHIFMRGDTTNCWTLFIKRQVFQGQHIHGLRINNDNCLVVYGGRKVALLKIFKFGKYRIRLVYSFEAPDWVLDCKWLEAEQAAILTANNALVLYNLMILKPVVISLKYCYERCILYSGTIIGMSWNDIIVLAGTVFSTIVIWENLRVSDDKEIIHRLEGHKGVIFSITFCKKNRRICSTSDDRTVRVWDVAFEEPYNWKKCTITLRFTLYGHSARVWRCSLFEYGKIVSVGEDSRICLWTCNGTLETQFSGHQDGEVWSLDVSEELQLIATGGSDGGISLWPMKKAQMPHELKCSDDNLKPKCVGLSAEGHPFMVSWAGDIFLFSDARWKLSLSAPDLKSYCLHAVTPDRQLVAFASITGCVIICRFNGDSLLKVVDMDVCEGRIFSIIWISSSSILICKSAGEFSIWKLSIGPEILGKQADFILPYSKERWVTACSAADNYVVCGDRCGSLYLYKKEGQNKSPVHIAKKIHGHNGVTDVKFLNGNFVSTGRDGKYREFLVENDKLVMLRCYKLKLDWAAAVCDSDLLGRVLFCFHEMSFVIWNVKGRQEIVKIDCGGGHRSWDCTISSTQNCIFMTFIKGKSVNYCCIPIKDVLGQSLLPGSHPKSINSADFVNNYSAGGASKLILLGGEDTTLRLVSVSKDNQSELRVLQNHLSSVRAVACHLSTFGDAFYVASGGGRGQMVFWKVYLSENKTLGEKAVLDIVELYSHFVIPKMKTGVSTDAAEMRIMDLQVYQTCSASVMIAACCSDGVLRIFNCSVDSNCILEVQAIDCQNCLLKVRVSYTTSDPWLIVTTTTGSLFFYSIESSGQLASDKADQRLSVSETGINSCDHSEVSGKLIVACAGDDALVNILLFDRKSSDVRFRMTDKWVHNAAHTCQVSGLKIMDNLLFTVALDQKLAVFSWTISENLIRAEMINRVDLCIPDIHGVLVWPSFGKETYDILVYGLGTELVTFTVVN